jgi:hypothetical protein
MPGLGLRCPHLALQEIWGLPVVYNALASLITAIAARAAGLTVALVDHDALTRPDGARQAVAHQDRYGVAELAPA